MVFAYQILIRRVLSCGLMWRQQRGTLLVLICLFSVIGCGFEPEIRQYSIPRKKKATANQPSSSPQLLLAAILPKDKDAWGLKLMGAPEIIQPLEEPFRKMLSEMTFDTAGSPKWKLPEGWRQGQGDQFTFASIFPTSEDVPRITISKLAAPDDLTESTWREYVAMNVNRWRGQLNLAAQPFEEMQAYLQPLDALAQPPLGAYFLTLNGNSSGAGRGPAMMSMQRKGEDTRPPSKVDYKLPDGWTDATSPGEMRMASFKIHADNGPADVSVMAVGGDERSNVERWQQQLTPEVAQGRVKEVLDKAQQIVVNEIPSKVYYLTDDAAENKEAILAAIIPWQATNSLFVKLKGPASIAEANRQKFLDLVSSLKW